MTRGIFINWLIAIIWVVSTGIVYLAYGKHWVLILEAVLLLATIVIIGLKFVPKYNKWMNVRVAGDFNVGGEINTREDLLVNLMVMGWIACNLFAYWEYSLNGCIISNTIWLIIGAGMAALKRNNRKVASWLATKLPYEKETTGTGEQ